MFSGDRTDMNAQPTDPTRLFLVRHGEVEGDRVLHGHVDVRLTPRGVQQLLNVAERLSAERLAAVYGSDLQRSRIGAEAVAAPHGLPVATEPSLRELAMGEWDGKSFHEVLQKDPVRMKAWWADIAEYVLPGGESLLQLKARVLPTLTSILDRHRGKDVCLVAHGGVNRIILFDALGLQLSHYHNLAQDYGCVNLIEYHGDGNRIVRLMNG
jgi:alpha-ribazole phosphatase